MKDRPQKLTSVSLCDFKGGSVTLDVSLPTVLSGQNGIGKSRILDGIIWCLTGRVPSGKALEEVARYVGVRGGAVRLDLADGSWMQRRLVRDLERMKNSEEVDGSDGFETAFRIDETVLCISEFLGLSVQRRREFLLELCGAGKLNVDRLIEMVGEEYSREVAGPGAARDLLADPERLVELPEDMAELVHAWGGPRGIREDLRAALVGKRDDTASAACQRLTDLARARKNIAASAKNAAKSAMHELDVGLAGHQAAAAELATVTRELAEAEKALSAAEKMEAARREAKRALDDAKMAQDRASAAAEATGKRMLDTAEPGPEPPQPDTSAHHARFLALTSEIKRIRDGHAAEESRARAREKAETDVAWCLNDVAAHRGTLASHDSMPVGRLARAIALMEGRTVGIGNIEIVEIVLAAKEVCAEWQLGRARLAAVIEEAEGYLAIAQKAIDDSPWHLSTPLGDPSAAIAALESERGAVQAALDAEIQSHSQAMMTWRAASAERSRVVAAWLTALAIGTEAHERFLSAEARLEPLADHPSPDTIGFRVSGLRQAVAAAQKASGVIAAYEDARATASGQTVAWGAWKRVEASIALVREEYVAEVTMPILIDLATVLRDCGRTETPYLEIESDRGRAVFELGWINGERRVALEALSGGEAAIFIAALAVVLSRRSGGLVLVLIEADTIDDDHLDAVLVGLGALECDGLIIATARDLPRDIDLPWRVYGPVELSGQKAKEITCRR